MTVTPGDWQSKVIIVMTVMTDSGGNGLYGFLLTTSQYLQPSMGCLQVNTYANQIILKGSRAF